MTVKFSIITVTYNAEHTIERTLRSVLRQTYPHVEHLVIDGASTDRTIPIVSTHGYTPLHTPSTPHPGRQQPHPGGPQRHFLSQPDHGLYDAMNKALRLATGDYLCFLNAGDTLHHPDTLRHLAQAAQPQQPSSATLPAVLYGDTHIVGPDGRFLRNRRLTPPRHLTSRSFLQGMLVCHQAFYASRHIVLPYNLTYRFSADFDWCIRCLKEGERQGLHNIYIKEPLADYLAEGLTTANQRASLVERFRIMAHHYGLPRTLLQHLWFVLRAITLK